MNHNDPVVLTTNDIEVFAGKLYHAFHSQLNDSFGHISDMPYEEWDYVVQHKERFRSVYDRWTQIVRALFPDTSNLPMGYPEVTNADEGLAGRLYTVYCRAVGGKAFNGDALPDWKEFSVDLKKLAQSNAWRAVAREALEGVTVLNKVVAIEEGRAFKRPHGVFWLNSDIGSGKKWHLCVIEYHPRVGMPSTAMLKYLQSDYMDRWHDEEWMPEDIREIEVPSSSCTQPASSAG